MPNRVLRDGILSSERVDALSDGAEILYRRLMSVVDDYGRYYAHPTLIRSACWPLRPEKITDDQVQGWLSECFDGENPLIIYYRVGDKYYIQLSDFKQRTRSTSKFPEPQQNQDGSVMRAGCARNDSGMTAGCARNDSELRAECARDAHVDVDVDVDVDGDGDGDGDVDVDVDGARAPKPGYQTTEAFDKIWVMHCSTGKPVNEQDRMKAAGEWVMQDCDQCAEDVLATYDDYLSDIEDLTRNREYRMIAALHNWLKGKPWTRRPEQVPKLKQSSPQARCPLCGDTGVRYEGATGADIHPVRCTCGAGLAVA